LFLAFNAPSLDIRHQAREGTFSLIGALLASSLGSDPGMPDPILSSFRSDHPIASSRSFIIRFSIMLYSRRHDFAGDEEFASWIQILGSEASVEDAKIRIRDRCSKFVCPSGRCIMEGRMVHLRWILLGWFSIE
jgi:hypothetical protein